MTTTLKRLKDTFVESLTAICTMSGRDEHYGSHIVYAHERTEPATMQDSVRQLALASRKRRIRWGDAELKITEPSVEGFVLLLEQYARMLDALAESWRVIAKGTEEDREQHPAEIWLRDAMYASELANQMSDSAEALRKAWDQTPSDMREIVEIKVRKVKQLDVDN